MTSRCWVLVPSFALALTSCRAPAITISEETPRPSEALSRVRLKLTRVANIPRATAFAVRADDAALYVAAKSGQVWALDDGSRRLVLDIGQEVTDLRNKQEFNEQGLLGLAFSPDGSRVYVHFTGRDGNSVIRRYGFRDGRADPSTAVDVLRIQEPTDWHIGGETVFGPDGLLYLGIGDGGAKHGATGQRLDTLLGKILRIDPEGATPYRIPPGNPFVGVADARPEIFSYGLRNPWRFSFDRLTGDLWIADVGENRWEEIDFRPSSRAGGENFGWNIYEGPVPFAAALNTDVPTTLDPRGRYVLPIYAYPHPHPGCAASVGGYVYRGKRISRLRGAYVFGDLCDGKLRALRARSGRVVDQQIFEKLHALGMTSFGEDNDGELYVLSLSAGVFRIDPA